MSAAEPARRVSKNAFRDRELREERRELISTMLLTKTPYRTMAVMLRAQLGVEVAHGTIYNDVKVIRDRWQQRMAESYESHVAEQMSYYDGLLRAIAPTALAGEHQAVQDMLGVMDRRARLLGLEVPTRVDARVLTQQVGPSVAEQLGQLSEGEADDRAIGIAAILAEAGAVPDGAAIEVESHVREPGPAAGADDPEAHEVHHPGSDDEAGGVSAA